MSMNSNRHGEWPLDQKVTNCDLKRCLFNGTISQIYIGDLGNDATRYELEDAFSPFGSVKNVWIAKRPPGGQSFVYIFTEDKQYGNISQVLRSF